MKKDSIKNKIGSVAAKVLSPFWRIYKNFRIRDFWLLVLVLSYFNSKKALQLAIEWQEDSRKQIIKYHRENRINHLEKDPNDNLALHLAIIEQEKKIYRKSLFGLRYFAWQYIKGEMIKIERRLKWI